MTADPGDVFARLTGSHVIVVDLATGRATSFPDVARAVEAAFAEAAVAFAQLAQGMRRAFAQLAHMHDVDELRRLVDSFTTAHESVRVAARQRSHAAIAERARLVRRYPPPPLPEVHRRGFRCPTPRRWQRRSR